MSSFFLSLSKENKNSTFEILDDVYQHTEKQNTYFYKDEDVILACNKFNNSPLIQNVYSNDVWEIVVAGDLIDYNIIPYQLIIDAVEKKSFEKIKNLSGVFAIIVYNKILKEFYIFSDRIGFYPIYSYSVRSNFIISSELSLFCRLLTDIKFNRNWLYQYMYYGFAVNEATFLEDVNRVPAASILIYNLISNKIQIIEYAEIFHKKKSLLKGIDAYEFSKNIFKERIIKYFGNGNEIACALTSGWDGRTNLALAPQNKNITAYTYGMIDCDDMTIANLVAKRTNTNHLKIPFNTEVADNIPNLMLETIFKSQGLERVLRAYLKHVYKILSKFPLIISGVGYDALFRGHLGIASQYSPFVGNTFRTGKIDLGSNYFSKMFNCNSDGFNSEIKKCYLGLQNKFGDFQSTETHLLFATYVSGTRYFLGEWKIADSYSNFRAPAYDSKIIDLAYSIEGSTLSFSQLSKHKRLSRSEMILQSYIMNSISPEFANIPIDTIGFTKPNIVLKGDYLFNAYKLYRRILNKSKHISTFSKSVAPEDWNNWLNVKHKKFIDDLIFSNDSYIKKYFNEDFLHSYEITRERSIIGKLLTLEIILRLIINGWQKFW